MQRVYSVQPRNKLLNQYDIFWAVTSCSFIDRYQRFGANFCLHIQGKILLLKVVATVSYETYVFTKSLAAHSVRLIKVKYKLTLSKTWRHRRGVAIMLHSFLTLVLGGVEWSAAFPKSFTRWERTPPPIDKRLFQLCSYRQIHDCVNLLEPEFYI